MLREDSQIFWEEVDFTTNPEGNYSISLLPAEEKKRPVSVARFGLGFLVGGASGAGACALASGLGAELLRLTAANEHACSAAAGGAVLFSLYGGMLLLLQNKNIAANVALSIGLVTLSGALGEVILQSEEINWVSSVSASAVGAVLLSVSGAAVALGVNCWAKAQPTCGM